VPKAVAPHLARAGAQVEIIRSASHMPFLTDPEEFLTILLPFLAGDHEHE
jgi:pimeloyl-ACP methyl ester carboxylesterase